MLNNGGRKYIFWLIKPNMDLFNGDPTLHQRSAVLVALFCVAAFHQQGPGQDEADNRRYYKE